jgi:hypothetical protein
MEVRALANMVAKTDAPLGLYAKMYPKIPQW